MFSLYFLATYINMVKHLQRFPLNVSINWGYLHQDQRKTCRDIKDEIILEVFKSNHLASI